MKNVLKVAPIVGLLVASQLAYAAPVTDTYTTGDTLTADKMNNIKSAVNDNNTRLTTNETTITSLEAPKAITDFFDGYWAGFSAIGSPKNVVVTEKLNQDGSKSYQVRSAYENSSETVSVNGAPVVAPFIGLYLNVFVDSNVEVTYIGGETEAPATASYSDLTIEEFTYDNAGITKTVQDDTRRQVIEELGGGSLGHRKVTETSNGTQTDAYHSVRAYTHLGAGTLNGIQYSDLRGASRMWSQGHSYRVSAKGIGQVFDISCDDCRAKVAIYYRTNGTTGGSLAGTPFASGAALDGIFF